MSMTKKVTKWQMVVDGDASGAMRALNKVGSTAKKLAATIGVAFSVAKVIDFGKSIVNAMMEDQKSAAILAKTLQNVTKARKSDIAAVEDYIKKTTLATGIADDQLRPAFARLVRSTKNSTKAQDLLNLSLDISSATGRDLETVANSVSKAYDGNFTALRRLGLSVDQNLIKSKDFAKVQAYLQKVFGGSMATATQTLAGRMLILKNAFAEMKEDIGYALLPALEKLAGWMAGPGMAAITAFFDALTGRNYKTSNRDAASRLADSWMQKTDPLTSAAGNLGGALRGLGQAIADLFKAFGDGTSAQSGFAKFVQMIADLVDDVRYLVQAFGGLTTALKNLNTATGGKPGNVIGNSLKSQMKYGPLGSLVGVVKGFVSGDAIGGTIPASSMRLVGERGPELWKPSTNGTIYPNNALGGSSGGVNVVVNVAGSVIAERDLAVRVRDEMAQLIRRRGLSPSVLGV